jgi:hypothetical protein
MKDTQAVDYKGFMVDRKIIKVAVTPSSKQVIERTAHDNDMTEQGVASRIYEWFGQQPPGVKALVLGLVPKDLLEDVHESLLKQLLETKQTKRPRRRGGASAA